MPLASTCICGNAADKFMYMRQCRWEATIPLAKSCICGNAAGKRQCRWQVHVYTAIQFSCKNAMSNQHYRTRDGINIIANTIMHRYDSRKQIPLASLEFSFSMATLPFYARTVLSYSFISFASHFSAFAYAFLAPPASLKVILCVVPGPENPVLHIT